MAIGCICLSLLAKAPFVSLVHCPHFIQKEGICLSCDLAIFIKEKALCELSSVQKRKKNVPSFLLFISRQDIESPALGK